MGLGDRVYPRRCYHHQAAAQNCTALFILLVYQKVKKKGQKALGP